MHELHDAYEEVTFGGHHKSDRTGTGTISRFGNFKSYDLFPNRLPLATGKKTNIKAIVRELEWFFRGETNIKTLDSKIWDEWADENGELGPIYGKQWRRWEDIKLCDAGVESMWEAAGYSAIGTTEDGQFVMRREIDQIAKVIEQLKTDPDSRRILLSAWNVGDLEQMALNPCHVLVQFYTHEATLTERRIYLREVVSTEKLNYMDTASLTHEQLDELKIPRRMLSSMLYQRSGDMFLGVPFNIASYSILTHLLAKECGMIAYEFKHIIGDAHVYSNHREQIDQYLELPIYKCPSITFDADTTVENFCFEKMHVHDYIHGPVIKAPVAV
jgi:thymidylate synthase